MKKSTKKIAIKTYRGTYTYQGTVDLAKLGGFVFNHGTASSKHTRTHDHKRDCLDQQLVYEVRREAQDRLFGNKVIASSYDKVFVAKVVEELNKTVLLGSAHKAMMLKDWKASLPMLSNIERGYYDALCKANLSETECCFIPNKVNESDLNAVIRVVDAWYYTDKSIRVPAVALKNNTLHFSKKHLVGGKLIKFIEKHFPKAEKMLHTPGNTIVLIGQFCHDFVAALAMFNKVIIWHDTADQQHTYEYEALNNRITYIKTMEELIDNCMNVDPKNLLIIANPPYNTPGANITKAIVDNIDYAEYVNLMPANDYKRNDCKDLFKYVDLASMKVLPKELRFKDAVVTPVLARINKAPDNSLTQDTFELASFTDNSLKPYLRETRAREHYAIDAGRRPQFSSLTSEDNTNTILLGIRDMNHKHLAYDKTCDTYLWNAKKLININKLKSNIGKTGSANKQASHYFITFKTSVEKDNFAEFMYSTDGFRFLSKVFAALNVDSMIPTGKFLPKVDWTRSWTVEEILADYGYTQSEIDEVMADLVNFKGMED